MVNISVLGVVLLSAIKLFVVIIETGLEHAPFVVLVFFFPHLNMQKHLLIMGHNNTKISSLKCDFLIFI
jgi:hypothetical protein